MHPWRAAVPHLCLSLPFCKTGGGKGGGETILRILPGFYGDGIGMGAEQGGCHFPCREEISEGFLEEEEA